METQIKTKPSLSIVVPTFNEREKKLSAKVTKEYLVQVWGLRKREIKHKDLVVKKVAPEKLATYVESLNRVMGTSNVVRKA